MLIALLLSLFSPSPVPAVVPVPVRSNEAGRGSKHQPRLDRD